MKKNIFLLMAIFAITFVNAQYSTIAIVGDGVGGWPTGAVGEVDQHQMSSSDGINWSLDNLVTSAGAVKFRAANSWTENWGAAAGAFPAGTAILDGGNINVPAGIYNVKFNSTTLAFSFTPSSLYPVISLEGTGVGGSDIDLGTTDGIHYYRNAIAINGGIRFRKNHANTESWMPQIFPSGTAVGGTEMFDLANGVYNVTFNINTLEYSFSYPSIAIVGNSTPQGWPNDPQVDTHILNTTDGIHYVIDSITVTSGAIKFRQDNSWTTQWGGDGGFPLGTGLQDGIDINIPAGTYSITFNRDSGAYAFGTPIGGAALPACTLLPVDVSIATSGNAALATDNISSTRWESDATDNQSLTIDLGTLTTISAITIAWDTYNAKDYFIRGSVNGTDWVDIAEKTNMPYGARIDAIENLEAQYRYLKMDGVTRNTQYGYAIYEFSICGTPITADTAKRILFIGNSYTYYNNLPTMVKNMAASTGDALIPSSYTVGGMSLEGHSNRTGTTEALKNGNWDYVVLQDQSKRPALEESYVQEHVYPFAKQLSDLAREYSPCVDLFFYQTWGHENGDLTNCPSLPEVCTYEGMDDRLALRYSTMAQSNNASVSPVGAVRRQIRSLYPEIDLYDADGSHPTLAGTYVAAATFYTVILRKDPTLITYNTKVLGSDVANKIKAVVKSVVFDNLSQWNVGDYDPSANFTFEIDGNTTKFTNTSENADSYLWDFGDGSTSTEENPEHVFIGEGPFTVTLSASKCNKTNTSVQESIVVGTPEISFTNSVVYPNPATDSWNITSSNNVITAIQVFDLTGKVVISITSNSKVATLDASKLTNGIYFAKITSDLGVRTLKLIKN